MPERIETAEVKAIDTDTLEVDDRYPGTLGFLVNLTRDPGIEWGVEFDAAYDSSHYAGKPPVVYRGDRIEVYYLPRYANDLPTYIRFLTGIVAETNRAVDLRNRVLPDEERVKQEFRTKLREVASQIKR